jgi:hypothetical protein
LRDFCRKLNAKTMPQPALRYEIGKMTAEKKEEAMSKS